MYVHLCVCLHMYVKAHLHMCGGQSLFTSGAAPQKLTCFLDITPWDLGLANLERLAGFRVPLHRSSPPGLGLQAYTTMFQPFTQILGIELRSSSLVGKVFVIGAISLPLPPPTPKLTL